MPSSRATGSVIPYYLRRGLRGLDGVRAAAAAPPPASVLDLARALPAGAAVVLVAPRVGGNREVPRGLRALLGARLRVVSAGTAAAAHRCDVLLERQRDGRWRVVENCYGAAGMVLPVGA